jgi:integrase/recombinase XerD
MKKIETDIINKYVTYLNLEKGLSDNTSEAYFDDLSKLLQYIESEENIDIFTLSYNDLQHFVAQLNDLGITARSQARIISGIKSFYRFIFT